MEASSEMSDQGVRKVLHQSVGPCSPVLRIRGSSLRRHKGREGYSSSEDSVESCASAASAPLCSTLYSSDESEEQVGQTGSFRRQGKRYLRPNKFFSASSTLVMIGQESSKDARNSRRAREHQRLKCTLSRPAEVFHTRQNDVPLDFPAWPGRNRAVLARGLRQLESFEMDATTFSRGDLTNLCLEIFQRAGLPEELQNDVGRVQRFILAV